MCLRRGRSTPAMRAIVVTSQPWRCLWRGFSQMMRTTPRRRTTLHLSQIFLTLGRTFMALRSARAYLSTVRDAAAAAGRTGETSTVTAVAREQS